MPIHVHCPACGQKLGIPDQLVGHKVRCSKCQTEFLAQEEMPVEIIEGPPPAASPAPLPRELPDDLPEATQDLDDDRGDEGRRRRKRKRKRVSDPTAQLQLPGWFLVGIAIVGGVITVGYAIFSLVVNLTLTGPGRARPGTIDMGPATAIISSLVQIAVTVIWSLTVYRGGMSMVRLYHYQTAMTGCIVAMLPCSCGCWAGIPVGIWGLIVLLQDDVKRAF
jgi:hypothetical protein